MTLFPLDQVRNAAIDQPTEVLLEAVRNEVAAFLFPAELGGQDAVLEAFDLARARLNVVVHLAAAEPIERAAEISTGLGFVAAALHRAGTPVIVTESDPAIAAYPAHLGIEVRSWHIGREPVPIEPASMDLVVCAEVLEHLKSSPAAVLTVLAELLRPGGRLIATTPNIARVSNLSVLAAGESILEPLPAGLPVGRDFTEELEHVREYSIREVVDAAEEARLAVEQVLMTDWGEGGYAPPANPFGNGIMVLAARR